MRRSASMSQVIGARQYGYHFTDDIIKLIFLYGNCCMLLRFVLHSPADNKTELVSVLVSLMATPLSEPMLSKFVDTYVRHAASMR